MITPAEVHKRLELIERRLYAAQSVWQQQCKDIRREWTVLQKNYPHSLKPNAWATRLSCSVALERLEAIIAHLQKRVAILSKFGLRLVDQLPLHALLSNFLPIPIGPETGTWQLICAILAAEADLEEERRFLQRAQTNLTHSLANMASLRADLDIEARSDQYVKYLDARVRADEVTLALETAMEEADPGETDNWMARLVSETLECCKMRLERSGWASVEARMIGLMAMMARRGIKMARQTVITEYFEPQQFDPML